MNLLAITQHAMLLERLRTAFEGAGHSVTVVQDHLHALASEAWNGSHLLVVDAAGEPLDGYRLCHLLRAESRSLFRNMPIFIILDHPALAGRQRLQQPACQHLCSRPVRARPGGGWAALLPARWLRS